MPISKELKRYLGDTPPVQEFLLKKLDAFKIGDGLLRYGIAVDLPAKELLSRVNACITRREEQLQFLKTLRDYYTRSIDDENACRDNS